MVASKLEIGDDAGPIETDAFVESVGRVDLQAKLLIVNLHLTRRAGFCCRCAACDENKNQCRYQDAFQLVASIEQVASYALQAPVSSESLRNIDECRYSVVESRSAAVVQPCSVNVGWRRFNEATRER